MKRAMAMLAVCVCAIAMCTAIPLSALGSRWAALVVFVGLGCLVAAAWLSRTKRPAPAPAPDDDFVAWDEELGPELSAMERAMLPPDGER